MRTRRTLINMAYALGSSLLLLLLGLVTRRLLVYNFGTQISTASQVVSQLFNFFSIAEFGVGSVISYRLYEQIAARNEEKISKYMSMYKWAYRAVGLAIAVLALLGAAALPWIMPDVPLSTGYTVYALNVVSTLCSYFLVTRRLMYTCTQQGYLCTRIDFCFNVLTSLAKIAVSLWFPNYVLYFSVAIVCNVCANLVIARRFRKDFPYVREAKVSLRDFRELGIFHDLRYYLVHRLSNTIYGSSDTIVTARMGGSAMTTRLGNYTNISTSATDLGNKIMDSFAAAIGNIVYDKSAAANDHDKRVFWGMDLFSYLFASFVATAYFCLFQPFMEAWMGPDWLLPLSFVLVFCLNEYVGWNHRILGSYRAVLGHFEQDQWFMVASAAVNLILSFALFPAFDITGALAATVAAHCIMWAGRIRVVFRQYMRGSMGHYLRIQALHAVTLAACMGLTWAACRAVPLGGWLGLAPRAVIVCLLPNLLNLAFYGWSSDAAYLREYAARIVRKRRDRT
ncbi:MAG TPA: polysaccharide biosynthesis C-terminal domain-containing protein [Candidatus Gemmiger avistercoris]|uniref:Polysaccharide biosynthesis C-terminal domain-containing protein n=1 Tax=Candidatus Gemmiger avistercoris TaxID=2838606 RepID=A0A9D2JNZ6_9FIRM|nr:polysaccharide biosynthesis C-terminal domain-containing protein [uncultured Subdoligranulum sp.]HIZ61851.1 polysaccharide biosynthesis C-terminal domain-containing protein [Candidatus Gemmiger avistercoris]